MWACRGAKTAPCVYCAVLRDGSTACKAACPNPCVPPLLYGNIVFAVLVLVRVQGPGGVANLHVQTQLEEATGATHMLQPLLDMGTSLLSHCWMCHRTEYTVLCSTL
jgi:hypothetical protein